MTGTGVADGGDSSSVQQDLVDVVEIYSTRGAFAAVRKDGSVRTWGNERGMSCVGLAPYSKACHLRPVVCAAALGEIQIVRPGLRSPCARSLGDLLRALRCCMSLAHLDGWDWL